MTTSELSRAIASRGRPRHIALAFAVALACVAGGAGAATATASSTGHATITFAEIHHVQGSGIGTAFVVTVTNNFTSALTRIETGGAPQKVLPASACPAPQEGLACKLDVAPGASTMLCVESGRLGLQEAVEVTYANGSKETIEPRHVPEVASCPLGSLGGTSSGTAKCVVPNVKAKKLASAESVLKKANCAVGKIKKASSKHFKKGSVISESPAAGKSLPSGSRVSLTVSKGG